MFFSGCVIFVLPVGVLNKRLNIFTNQIIKYGGRVIQSISLESPTHIIIEDSLLSNPDNALKSVGIAKELFNGHIVGTSWLSQCLKEKKIVHLEGYQLQCCKTADTKNGKDESPNVSLPDNTQYNIAECSILKELHSVTKRPKLDQDTGFQGEKKEQKLPCLDSSINPMHNNEVIINELQKLVDAYKVRGDKWRVFAYTRAINAIKQYNKKITSVEDVRQLSNIGKKTADKIIEIIENGYLQKTSQICNDQRTSVLNLFTKVWGVGPTTAQLWYQQGFRTLQDVEKKANLTNAQKIGLKHYDDIQDRIPRSEVEQIINYITSRVLRIESSLHVEAVGSFRRGKETSGDINILLVKKNAAKCGNILAEIVSTLKKEGFIVDELTQENSGKIKFLGLCKLPDSDKVRRLDMFIVPESDSATALMHYTGSAWFNRSIRSHAAKMNMHLSESGLYSKGNDINGGTKLSTPTEESIFEHLGLQYQPPEDREYLQKI